MSNNIIIAVDAMGGDNSPMKIIDGIELSLKDTDENFFQLYGDEKILNTLIKRISIFVKMVSYSINYFFR